MRTFLPMLVLLGALLVGAGCASRERSSEPKTKVTWYCDQIHCAETREGPISPPPWCCSKRMVRHKSSELR
jgi:hypothetical protein